MPHDLSPFENDAFALAGRDAQIGFAGFAGAVDDAAEDADLDRRRAAREAGFELGDDSFEIDFQAAARGAGDEFRFADATPCRLQDIERGRDLRNRVAEQADADGIADAVE